MAKQNKTQSVADAGEVESFIIGTFIGAVVGAISAFWFAPRSGRETRHVIQERGAELRDDLEGVADETRKRIEGESLDDSIQAGKAQARRFQETATYRR